MLLKRVAVEAKEKGGEPHHYVKREAPGDKRLIPDVTRGNTPGGREEEQERLSDTHRE